MEKKMQRQVRAIRLFARLRKTDIESAAWLWVECGASERFAKWWAKYG